MSLLILRYYVKQQARLQRLLQAAEGRPEEQVQIFEGAQRLVDPDGMGSLYKALALQCLPPTKSGGDSGLEPPMIMGFAGESGGGV